MGAPVVGNFTEGTRNMRDIVKRLVSELADAAVDALFEAGSKAVARARENRASAAVTDAEFPRLSRHNCPKCNGPVFYEQQVLDLIVYRCQRREECGYVLAVSRKEAAARERVPV